MYLAVCITKSLCTNTCQHKLCVAVTDPNPVQSVDIAGEAGTTSINITWVPPAGSNYDHFYVWVRVIPALLQNVHQPCTCMFLPVAVHLIEVV